MAWHLLVVFKVSFWQPYQRLANKSYSAAMSLRRPPLIKWSNYMDESIEVLQNAPDRLPSDEVLCFWVRTQQIAEEVGEQFHMDDPNEDVSINDKSVNRQISAFRSRLQELQEQSQNVSTRMTNPTAHLPT